jgi:uncharacterized membrane protein YdbT with pleckstrin-like domain
MSSSVTEKEYPIQFVWVFKWFSEVSPYFILILVGYGSVLIPNLLHNPPYLSTFLFRGAIFWSIIISILGLISLSFFLKIINFGYSFEDKLVVLHQGVFNKESRNVSYRFIQNVILNQTLVDKIFGLSSITFDDASNNGLSKMSLNGYIHRGRSSWETIGFSGSRVHIPGLRKQDAENLKNLILQKVKENPIIGQSGL